MSPAAGTRLGAAALAVVAIVVALVLTGRDSGRYRISIPVPNASGLRDGSAVKVGGLDRGTVHLKIDHRDRVILTMDLDKAVGKVGRDARVAIVAANFLGIKRVELAPGHAATDPAPDGSMLPASRLTTPTDLDQVLNVFDADTRTRAKILLNAAGQAAAGRRLDISHFLQQLPLGMQQAGPVLRQVTTDDATMRDLIERSDRFVAEATAQRRGLSRLIDTLGQTGTTVVTKRAALRSTLAQAPQTLRTLRAFLGELRATTVDLGPAAREVTAAAAPLRDTLAQVDGFRRAAAPTLRTATGAAPDLTRLADGVTPVLRRLRPTLAGASTLAQAFVPVSTTLDNSADNIIAILENWSRAIQLRDQLGHVFRGEASFSPDFILTMVDRLAPAASRSAKRRRPALPATPPATATATAPSAAPAPAGRAPAPVLPLVKKVLGGVGETPSAQQITKALDTLLGPLAGPGQRDAGGQSLLDYLLRP